ncbi:hypothetical protein WOLCODRAFT_132641 [Wolfiporia cocos MD-104 SS10]|uniref:Amidohydrolase 3 domain-containing protein n=1 Tax=Wolfiporia cocos (strain MD-104) TaxID=742152 RepID=A0A2H3JMF4_WOLCO|nr:hypothetical protein WOLCODRAFT_132641 [Wolfiporia cocos MD-104 SS10]
MAAVAGLSTYISRNGFKLPSSRVQLVTSLPEAYAICADGIYTVDESTPNVDCLLIKRDRIIATGSLNQINEHWDAYQTELINKFYGGEPKAKKPLRIVRPPTGSIVVPGLADAHAHLIMYGMKMQLNLEGLESIDDVLDRIEAYVAAYPDTEWVEGFGWDQTRWQGWRGGFPDKNDLASRSLLATRALALSRVDGHALWVSPRALELAQANLPDGRWPEGIEGGEIVRGADGEPSGTFLDAAMALVPVPPATVAQLEERLERAAQDALAVGLTSVHDAAVSEDMVPVFKKMADEGRLPIRVYAMANSEQAGYWGDRFERLEDYGREGRLNMRSIKLFTDGALGSWGAALLEPYTDNTATRGIMRSSEEALNTTVSRFWADGWQVNIHCIGDRANKAVLDIFEGLMASNTSEGERRPRIEHAQIMRIEDLQRAGRLGVIPSVQPTHATSDMWYAETRLGPDRIKGAYAYQTLLQYVITRLLRCVETCSCTFDVTSRSSQDHVLPIGSDFPVESINPLLGFYAAVSRLDAMGNSPHGVGGWFSTERLTRAQALKGMTLDAAYASFAEHNLGTLAPGKKADYVVLDTDIVQEDTPVDAILTTKVRATVIDGRVMYGGI